jgi:hypothetical protein
MRTIKLFPGLATGIGSLPHKDMDAALDLVFRSVPDCPHWPQLQSLRVTEQMEIQPLEGMPGLRRAPDGKSMYVDTEAGQAELAAFYEQALAAQSGGGLDTFTLAPEYAQGLHAFLARLKREGRRPIVKGQLIAPFSLGFSITDQDKKPILYHPIWADVTMQLLGLKSLWQVRALKEHAEQVLFFLDEPMLAIYGSTAMLTVSREEVIARTNSVVDPLRAEGAVVGMHCCGNTDWGLVMTTNLDVINFDCYSFGPSLALYPREVNAFLARGGWFAVGAIPTIFPDTDTIDREDEHRLLARLRQWFAAMSEAGVDRGLLRSRVILTPACGCGILRLDQTEKIYRILQFLQEKYPELA